MNQFAIMYGDRFTGSKCESHLANRISDTAYGTKAVDEDFAIFDNPVVAQNLSSCLLRWSLQ